MFYPSPDLTTSEKQNHYEHEKPEKHLYNFQILEIPITSSEEKV